MTKPSQATPSSYTRRVAERQPMPNRLVRLLSEARWLALAAVGVYFVLILLSFHKADSGWSHAGFDPRVVNLGGRAGAWLADLLLFIFGVSAWWWCVLLLRLIWNGYRRLTSDGAAPDPEHQQERIIRGAGFVLLFIGSVGLENLNMHGLHLPLPGKRGGALGDVIGQAAPVVLGTTGATLLLLLLFGLGFSLFFHVSWLAVAERIGAAIEMSIDWLRLRYQDREDRRQGEAAAVKRDEVVVIERARHVDKHVAAKIEPQMAAVPRPEPVAMAPAVKSEPAAAARSEPQMAHVPRPEPQTMVPLVKSERA